MGGNSLRRTTNSHARGSEGCVQASLERPRAQNSRRYFSLGRKGLHVPGSVVSQNKRGCRFARQPQAKAGEVRQPCWTRENNADLTVNRGPSSVWLSFL